jgi:recombination protein RecT
MNEQALAPQSNGDTVLDWLRDKSDQITTQIPQHMDKTRLVALFEMQLRTRADLRECTVPSLVDSLLTCGALGLQIGLFNQAFLIPFKNRRANTTECTLIIGYGGLIDLATRSGTVKAINCGAVRACDYYERTAVDLIVRWDPALTPEERGEIVFVYCIIETKLGGKQIETMSVSEVDAVRAASPGGGNEVWSDHWEQMALKTVLRRSMKRITLSPEVQDSVTMIDRAEYRDSTVVDAHVVPPTGDSLKERLRARANDGAGGADNGGGAGDDVGEDATAPESAGAEAVVPEGT